MDNNKDLAQVNTPIDSDVNQVAKLESRVAELEDSWKRALADYKNLERRTAEEKADFAIFANMILIQRLLPLLDNMQMLSAHIDDTGLKMILKEFKQVLEDNGVTGIEVQGKEFDSSKMDCAETVPCDQKENNKVIEVISAGYMYKDKVLRPAKVRVGKGQ